MLRVMLCLGAALTLSGCAAIAPFSSLLSAPTGPPPLQVHEQTDVQLAKDNFFLVKTNVLGQSKGFSLLGIVTIYPATLTKAVNRLYANADMRPGHPQTVSHLVIEQTSSYWILFGIPQINVRADIVEFRPETPAPEPVLPPRPPASSP